MMKYILATLITFTTISSAFAGASSPGIYYVSPGTLNVRLAADKNGKRIKRLTRQQKVEVLEIKGEWARISPYYDGTTDGLSGNVAHWVAARFLDNSHPVKIKTASTKASETASQVSDAIKLSDNFSQYKSTFISASEKLINNKTCTLEDFKKLGGWWQSLKHTPKPVYVTYCGGTADSYRIYLNAETGETFK